MPLNLLEFLNQRFKWLPIIARNHLQAYLKSVHFQKSPTNIYRYHYTDIDIEIIFEIFLIHWGISLLGFSLGSSGSC